MSAHYRYPQLRKPSILIAIIFSVAILIGASFSLAAASSPREVGVNASQETLETPPSPLDTLEPPVSTPSPTGGWVPTATVTLPGVFTPTLAFTPTPTPTLAIVFTPTLSVTPGPTITATAALTVTTEPTVTLAPSEISPIALSPSITVTVYLPGVYDPGPIVPLARTLFCASPDRSIPDNNSAGINSQITINDNRFIADLDAQLNIVHTWVGDISVQLRHDETGRSITLIDRPGYPADDQGCSANNIKSILDDEMSTQAENKCATSPAIAGSYLPTEALSAFDGDLLTGTWTLTVADNSRLDTGSLSSWCLLASVSPNPPPTPTPPPPPDLPSSRIIRNVTGASQALPLDCEIRSAVDWARVFGRTLNEINFFNGLPDSANPDKGFVGNVYGAWGQIPPNDYGVHAEPIAARLRHYGLSAYAHRPLTWNALRTEIAAGRPVIVWIIGSLFGPDELAYGVPVYYTPPDGLHTVVARYEHTVVITGYTDSQIYYLNGPTVYAIPITQFLDSWSALGNMAITANP